MKTIICVLLCLSVSPLFGQIEARANADKSVPTGVEYQGTLAGIVNVTDKHGSSIIVVSQTPIQASKTWADSKESELFVYRYITTSGSPRQLWKVYDFVKECPLDVEATFLGGTQTDGVSVTDLDSDNDAEIWMAYRVICRGDVSPATVKIIMYEGNKKHAMRGESRVQVSATEYDGGKHEMDKDLLAASQAFRDYAQQLWDKIVTE